LVVNPIVDGAFLPKTLIDGGSSLNIIFTEMLRKMDFDFNMMTTCDEPFYGVVPGKAAYPIGHVCLPITFSTKENFRTEYLTFEVGDIRSSYHAIPGRPMLAKFMAIPHHTYLIMKMPAPNGILSILGDVMVSYNCESATVELSKDSAVKAATTVMVAQAANVTPDFPKKTKCISYVRQDQVYTHMIDDMSEISINNNKKHTRVKPLHYLFITLKR
jgi:hypothetical protein